MSVEGILYHAIRIYLYKLNLRMQQEEYIRCIKTDEEFKFKIILQDTQFENLMASSISKAISNDSI